MEELSFREATEHDLESCISILQENYPDPKDRHWDEVFLIDFKDVLNKKYVSKFIIVQQNNLIVGFGCYIILRADMYKLSWINIIPSYKNKGIGTLLVKELEQDVIKNISSSAKLHNINIVLETDKPSFYNKLGYTTFNEQNSKDFMVKSFPL